MPSTRMHASATCSGNLVRSGPGSLVHMLTSDSSAQQLQFNNGQLAAILHDLPSSAVEQYLNNSKYSHYSLPTMMANFIYINPTKGTMKDQATRTAVMDAIDVDTSNPDNQLISNLVHTQLAAA